MKRFLLLALLPVMMLASCSKDEPETGTESQSSNDTSTETKKKPTINRVTQVAGHTFFYYMEGLADKEEYTIGSSTFVYGFCSNWWLHFRTDGTLTIMIPDMLPVECEYTFDGEEIVYWQVGSTKDYSFYLEDGMVVEYFTLNDIQYFAAID